MKLCGIPKAPFSLIHMFSRDLGFFRLGESVSEDKSTSQKPGLFHGPCDGADVQSSSAVLTENGVDRSWLWLHGTESAGSSRQRCLRLVWGL